MKVELQSSKEILEQAKAELDKHKGAVLAHLTSVKERGKTMRDDLPSAQDVEALQLFSTGGGCRFVQT